MYLENLLNKKGIKIVSSDPFNFKLYTKKDKVEYAYFNDFIDIIKNIIVEQKYIINIVNINLKLHLIHMN